MLLGGLWASELTPIISNMNLTHLGFHLIYKCTRIRINLTPDKNIYFYVKDVSNGIHEKTELLCIGETIT